MLLQRESKEEIVFSVAKMLRKNFTEANCVVEEGGSSGLNENDHSRLIDVNAWSPESGSI